VADSAQSLWLQSAERLTESVDAVSAARWGSLAQTWFASSSLVLEAPAIAEALRQLDFVKGPLVFDKVELASVVEMDAFRGRCVSVDGKTCFLLGGSVDHVGGVTTLDVLRKL
jgi:hypothetical protein